MKAIIKILLFLWELPQNLLGFLIEAMFHRDGETAQSCGKATEHIIGYDRRFPGGISLGRYIVINHGDTKAVLHERGHRRQSLMLGWLYLPVVGVPSIVHAAIHIYRQKRGLPVGNYYAYWCEAWADRLGGVSR